MNLQDLKNNRESIIAKITELVGSENVKPVMTEMVSGLDCCDSIDELIEGAISILDFEKFAKKDSKLTTLHNSIHEDEKYNQFTKIFQKI